MPAVVAENRNAGTGIKGVPFTPLIIMHCPPAYSLWCENCLYINALLASLIA